MAKRSPKTITISKQPGQISAPGGELTNYLLKNIPIWGNPQWLDAGIWRSFVRMQPIAVLCRDALADYLISLDWAIIARDSSEQDERKEDIKYYTKLFECGNAYYSELDFTAHLEWFTKDLFDLPFGTASEIGRENDDPEGKVVWIRNLDGGTLAPTLNKDFPVVQHYPSYQPVVFPKEFISRVYLSPRTEIIREGWGMPPPEKIYLAMEMLNRGDIYYSQLLLNTPEAGILDLGDMEKDSAVEWVKGFRDLLYGINALKIPVLYEHTTDAKWIPFGKLPSEIMYDNVTLRYAAVLTAGYGLTLSDIGFPSSSNGGETLAGTIRQERKSAKSGKSLVKKKFQHYAERILPEYLKWQWKDFDDEKNVAMGRARMASASAFKTLIDGQVVSPDEARRQIIADGVMTITMPEELDRKAIEWPNNTLTYQGVKNSGSNGKEGTSKVGSPKPPSGGGQGDTIPQQIISRNRRGFEVSVSKAIHAGNQIFGKLINSGKGMENLPEWEKKLEEAITGKSQMDLVSETNIDDTYNILAETLERSEWLDTVSTDVSKHINSTFRTSQKNRREAELLRKAEDEFINGQREDILLTESELENVNHPLLDVDVNTSTDIKKSILEKLIPAILLVSKSEILGYKFDIDTTQFQDHNTIKLARQVAEKVYQLLPPMVEESYSEVMKTLEMENK